MSTGHLLTRWRLMLLSRRLVGSAGDHLGSRHSFGSALPAHASATVIRRAHPRAPLADEAHVKCAELPPVSRCH